MKKVKNSFNAYLALLNYRNMPIQALVASPAQRLMICQTKTLLPTTKILLVPEVTMGQHQKILANKQHKILDLLFTFQSGLHYVLCYMNHSQAVILLGTNWIREKFKGFCLWQTTDFWGHSELMRENEIVKCIKNHVLPKIG